MKHICLITAAALLATAPLAGVAFAQSAKDQMTGAWNLVSIAGGEGDKKVEPYGPTPQGAMFLAPSGQFSVAIVKSGIGKFAINNREQGTAEENKAVVQGSLAYFGSYAVDEAAKAINVKITGSTFPNFEGTDQKRLYALDGDTLTLSNPTPSAGGVTLVQVWKRVK
jgi:hypothetical protein